MYPEAFKIVSRRQEAVFRCPQALTVEAAKQVRKFHSTFPMYAPTPLVSLADTARCLGLDELYVKDESARFGLNAFKVLGGSYALGCILAERLGLAPEEMDFSMLTSPETRGKLGKMTFVTATDGNHGRGVAWSAARFGQQAVVYMPRGSAAERLENIRREGAEASIIAGNYDDAVRLASRKAQEEGWVLVQDTAWPGYEQIPLRIMQGYTTMALEALEQLPEKPTHVFLQAGVGSMAAAAAALIAGYYGEDRPVIVIVEPNKADCLFRTAAADDGQLHTVDGPMDTIMAGLACGEPCSIAWEILKNCADHFLSVPEYAAAVGMRILGNPAGMDKRVISGESGAAAFGALASILRQEDLGELREKLGLRSGSRVLCISTEGDTDRENYRAITWGGKFPGRN